jgi:hypothetical protein
MAMAQLSPIVARLRSGMRDAAQAVQAEYGREDRPLGGYLTLCAVYAGSLAALAAASRVAGVELPERVSAADLALLAAATHKASRTLSKDSVTSPLRAPFTRFEGAAAPGELHEEVRGKGARKAVGELLTCPFCLDQWIATGFLVGLVAAPRSTRWLAATFALRAGADALQFGYDGLQKLATD